MSNNAVAVSVLAVRSPAQLDPATHAECLQFIRTTIASNDRQTALDIKNVLAEVCASGYADRAAIWATLSQAEQQSFKELLAPQPEAQAEPTPTPTPAPETEPIALADNPQPLEPEKAIAPEDAEKMRDIALVWWPELYPECLQSLVTQMWGWGAPARKYSAAQIAQWLQGEDELVSSRIGELMAIGLADKCKEDEEE